MAEQTTLNTDHATDRLVWMDLEMTGLDPERDRIIEMATIITDAKLSIVDTGPVLAVHQDESILAAMDDWNTKHHGASGLLDRVRQSELTDRGTELETMAFIKRHVAARQSPLCGNSVWQDRRFLAKYMPELNEYLHYRNIDVSTIKELARRWYPSLEPFEKKKSHTALEDIKESIGELTYYRDRLFI